MSLLKELIKEMAAGGVTAASAVAAHPGSLFGGGMITRSTNKKLKRYQKIKPSDVKQSKNVNTWRWRSIQEMIEHGKGQREETTFDPADVISKLKAAEKNVSVDDDVVSFGLEDNAGDIVKVTVKADQAEEFESVLASMLAGDDLDDEEDPSSVEIAEVLFGLKDQFDIVDVEWPNIEGDEEEEQELKDDSEMDDNDSSFEDKLGDEDSGEMDDIEDGDKLDLGGDKEDGDMELPSSGDSTESALQQVIDMLKSDAEARKAESEARTEEAKARTAEANANAAAAKVRQEEQVLDMEADEKNKKLEDDETKRLARLAKWKHSKAQQAEQKMAEEEEDVLQTRDDNEMKQSQPISVSDLADELIRRLQGNIR